MKTLLGRLALGIALCGCLTSLQTVLAQGTAFTYQGQLVSNGLPAHGYYDFTFALFNNASTNTGQQVDATQTNLDVGVTNGLFIATLNFGDVFTGTNYWLSIGVRSNGGGSFTALNPLQELTPAPYAIYAPNAGAAASAASVAASNISGAFLPAQLPAGLVTNTETGVTLGGAFSGNGAVLTILNAASLTGSQSLPVAVLPTNVAFLNSNETFTGQLTNTGSASSQQLLVQNSNAAGIALYALNNAPSTSGFYYGTGVYAATSQPNGFGVYALNLDATGTGLIAAGNDITAGYYLTAGSGLAATGLTCGAYVVNTSLASGSESIYTINGNAEDNNVVRINYYNGVLYKIYGGGTVSTLVKDTENKTRVMFAPEAPEVLFEDYGNAQLTNGKAHIALDPVFAANIVVDAAHPLRVFVQAEGDCNGVYVTAKSDTGFDVVELAHGASAAAFAWHAVASRADEATYDTTKAANGPGKQGRISHYSTARFPLTTNTPTAWHTVKISGNPRLLN